MGSLWYGHLKWFNYFLHFDLSETITFASTWALPVASESCPLPLEYSRFFYTMVGGRGTLLNFGTKCEGKFVPVSPTRNVATEHVQCTAAAGLGWWENRISSRLCQPIRGKLWFWKLCVNQWQVACGSMPPVGQLRVTFFKKCGGVRWQLLKNKMFL